MKRQIITVLLVALVPMLAQAQLSSNPDKFLGNITTRYNVDAGGGVAPYYKLWNQITCENESKWGSVEGTRGSYNLSTMPSSTTSPTSSMHWFGVHSIPVGSPTCPLKTAMHPS